MSENLDAIFETKIEAGESSGQPQFNSPKLTLSVLRFVAGAALILGLLVAILSFMLFVTAMGNNYSKPDAVFYSLVVSIGALAQGFIIFALFNALALIVENLVGIRENLARTHDKV